MRRQRSAVSPPRQSFWQTYGGGLIILLVIAAISARIFTRPVSPAVRAQRAAVDVVTQDQWHVQLVKRLPDLPDFADPHVQDQVWLARVTVTNPTPYLATWPANPITVTFTLDGQLDGIQLNNLWYPHDPSASVIPDPLWPSMTAQSVFTIPPHGQRTGNVVIELPASQHTATIEDVWQHRSWPLFSVNLPYPTS
ncbi:hypothetical protein [Sulfobacillus thermosulfidooxidans]|uniref:hypothetical protein n=1 Tax=Sulfobacillus thermosulfidooxidans TaxID=28034 RepID=UPI0006B5087C|nr:hypothetical protein [Sulfobacillus thermosulfidooxidans]